jgi:hypothetical protein
VQVLFWRAKVASEGKAGGDDRTSQLAALFEGTRFSAANENRRPRATLHVSGSDAPRLSHGFRSIPFASASLVLY